MLNNYYDAPPEDFMPSDSEYSQYFAAFSQSARENNPDLKPEECRCNGGGWLLSDVDTWHKCGSHYAGQTHPEDYDLGPADDYVPAATPAAAPVPYVYNEEDVPF